MQMMKPSIMQKTFNDSHLVLDSISSEWAKSQAASIVENIPMTQTGSASGKFFKSYQQFLFHHSSSHPLIAKFRDTLFSNRLRFEATYNRPLQIEWIYLSYIQDPSENSCIPHRDGYWMNGQAHLTIQGNSGIRVWDEDPYDNPNAKFEDLNFENGTVWYLNGTELHHSILTTSCQDRRTNLPRIELLAPVEPKNLEGYTECLSPCSLKFIDPFHDKWKQIKEKQAMRQQEAFQLGKASAPGSVGFANLPESRN